LLDPLVSADSPHHLISYSLLSFSPEVLIVQQLSPFVSLPLTDMEDPDFFAYSGEYHR